MLKSTVLSGNGGEMALLLGLELVSVHESSSPEVLMESEHGSGATEGTSRLLSEVQGVHPAFSARTLASSSDPPWGAAGSGQGAREMWCAEFFGFLSLLGLDRGLLRQLL